MILFIINSVLALIGIYISWQIWKKKRLPEKMVCSPSADCDDVLTSKFSKYFGIDIENIGFVYYFILLIGYISLIIFSQFVYSTSIILTILLVSVIGLMFSIYLVLVQLLYIKNWCWWCLSSAGVSIIIFLIAITTFSNYSIEVSTFLAQNIKALLTLQLLGIAVGVSAATVSAILVIKFLKDFRIDTHEDKKLTILDQIIWLAIMILILVNLCFYLIDSGLYLNSSQFISQLFIFIVLILNNIFLSLYINPKLIGVRIDLRSINVMKTFWLRQYAIALGVVSLTSWYLILSVNFFLSSATQDVYEMISYYIAILIIGIILSQIGVLIVDKVKISRDNSRSNLKFRFK